ncbi:MAG TPA: hypothetical protein DIS76_03975 [Rhodospirillaceae bacterium]|nr:hypothetical protein [Rhodospirillaceae bacterium]
MKFTLEDYQYAADHLSRLREQFLPPEDNLTFITDLMSTYIGIEDKSAFLELKGRHFAVDSILLMLALAEEGKNLLDIFPKFPEGLKEIPEKYHPYFFDDSLTLNPDSDQFLFTIPRILFHGTPLVRFLSELLGQGVKEKIISLEDREKITDIIDAVLAANKDAHQIYFNQINNGMVTEENAHYVAALSAYRDIIHAQP